MSAVKSLLCCRRLTAFGLALILVSSFLPKTTVEAKRGANGKALTVFFNPASITINTATTGGPIPSPASPYPSQIGGE